MTSFMKMFLSSFGFMLLLLPIPVFYVRSDIPYAEQRDQQVESIRLFGVAVIAWDNVVITAERTGITDESALQQSEQEVLKRLAKIRMALSEDAPELVSKFESEIKIKQEIISKINKINHEIKLQSNTLLNEYENIMKADVGNELTAVINELLYFATLFPSQEIAQQKEKIDSFITRLKSQKEHLQQQAAQHRKHIDSFLRSTQKIINLKQKISILYNEIRKERIRKLAVDNINAINQEIRNVLKTREQTSFYLLIYAIILVIILAIFAYKLKRAYYKIKEKNERLYTLNATLEETVTQRTKELQSTLNELSTSQALLFQTEKLASVGQFVAGIAHEINTPLAYIKSSTEMLRTSLCKTNLPDFIIAAEVVAQATTSQPKEKFDQQIEALKAAFDNLSLPPSHLIHKVDRITDDCLHGIQQIIELIDGLRKFLRKEGDHYAAYNLNNLINDTLRLLQHTLTSRHIGISLNIDQTYYIDCIPSQISQVLINLINNAIYASQSKQMIQIKVFMQNPQSICIEIQDHGKGISSENLAKIFDPFFTTKPIGKGTGLGLFICYNIIQNHNGKIHIDSKINQGTTVRVILPIKQPQNTSSIR